MLVCMLLGPSSAGLTMTALLDSRAGLYELRSRLLRWRVALRWYALSLLTLPVLMLAVLWFFSFVADPAFAPRWQWLLFAIGLVAGTFEEIGWTGYATPRLLQRWRPDWQSRACGSREMRPACGSDGSAAVVGQMRRSKRIRQACAP